MLSITDKVVQELDLLYGLYELAIDLSKKLEPDDPAETQKWLDSRQRILARTGESSKEALLHLNAFDAMTMVPANERALVDEKRRMIQDLSLKMTLVDNQIIKKMHSKMSLLRAELARGTQRKNAAKSYLATSMTQRLMARV